MVNLEFSSCKSGMVSQNNYVSCCVIEPIDQKKWTSRISLKGCKDFMLFLVFPFQVLLLDDLLYYCFVQLQCHTEQLILAPLVNNWRQSGWKSKTMIIWDTDKMISLKQQIRSTVVCLSPQCRNRWWSNPCRLLETKMASFRTSDTMSFLSLEMM